MASAEECAAAIKRLARELAKVDPDVRRRRVPDRSVSLHVTDLDIAFRAHIGPEGLTDVEQVAPAAVKDAQLRLAADSDALLDVANEPRKFGTAFLRGRVKLQAGLRDLIELRSVL